MTSDRTEDQNSVPGEALGEVTGNATSQIEPPCVDEVKTTKHVAWGGENKKYDEQDSEDEKDGDGNGAAELNTFKKKRKTKRKPRSQRANKKGTGFEEYFVDAPITPEVFAEEQALYDPSKAFVERIQTCIQRYVARRKFDNVRKGFFDKYLAFGGVDSGPKMYAGGCEPDSGELTADEIARLNARHFIDNSINDHSVVDFDGVLRAYLSSRVPDIFDLSTKQSVETFARTIRNFLNYLLHHDVCPEYKDQINAARNTCDLAEKELWLIQLAKSLLPGDFNKACSLIFGGKYRDIYKGDREWASEMHLGPGMSEDEARKIFQCGLAAQGTDAHCETYNKHIENGRLCVLRKFETFVEIIDIEFSSEEVREMYKQPEAEGAVPVGKLKLRTWHPPCPQPEDRTEEEEDEIKTHGLPIHKYELFMEDKILEKLSVGMKMQCKLHELSFGVWFVDSISAILCSFYNHVPNEDMLGWREHKFLPQRESLGPDKLEVGFTGDVPDEEQDNDKDGAGGEDEIFE